MISLLVKLIPVLLITNSLFMAGWASNFLKEQIIKTGKPTAVLAVTASPAASSAPAIIPAVSSSPTPTPTPIQSGPAPSASPEVKTFVTNNYITMAPSPTPTPTPTPSPTPSPTPTPTPLPTINMRIKTPDSNSTFIVEIQDNINACDALTEAKNQGKIASLTLDDSYLATFHTLLVSEINGLSNYWVFTVNGNSPDGCSLINLHSNDQVVWEYVNGGN